ncbi:MAG: hypothetical protein OIF35_02785 [Cellvibrionaceae bacterium]|nr:hypothetical protein [Cellvibrionaceae bacterium]MCV6625763.1 hypothetical protein [Cellvibrionaceae bacterium]
MTDIHLQTYQGIYLFSDDRVSRQMLVEEFESVLDGFVPLSDYAGRRAQCAFAILHTDLSIDALVCFNLDFDHSGRPDIHWNTPIKQLAQQAAMTTCHDLHLRLASYNCCSVAWHQQKLWEPNAAQIKSLLAAISDNRLQLGKLAQRRAATSEIPKLNLSSSADLSALPLEQYREQEAKAQKIDSLQRTLAQQKKDLEALQRERSSLIKQLNDERESRQQQLQQQQDLLKQRYAKLLHQNVAVKAAQLQHAEQQLMQFEQRYNELQGQNKILLAQSEDSLVQQFSAAGINLEVDQPGVGRLRIAAADIYEYMAAPMVYVANCAGVSSELYGQWLAQRKKPICRGFEQDGQPCREALDKVGSLEEFVPGVSDHCVRHRQVAEDKSA